MDKVFIRYIDSYGDISERLISEITKDNEDSIIAYCHVRKSRRTFKLDNIIAVVESETG